MDFRVKKLILEEGMKNIAETEGVKLEMSFDSFTKLVTVDFMYGKGGLHKETSYDCVEREDADIFKTIEDTRREVQAMKNPTTIGFMNGINGGIFHRVNFIPKIKNVIFNYPATIVFWADGDKTVVKCQNGDLFDAEKGIAMAIIKKLNGGKGNYCEIFKPWIEKYYKDRGEELMSFRFEDLVNALAQEASIEMHVDIDKKDFEDILEGKVDPLMIKTDEDEEECRSEPVKDEPAKKAWVIGVLGDCATCRYSQTPFKVEPCKTCLECVDTCNRKILPHWEPKEEKPVRKECSTCKHALTDACEEPCIHCTEDLKWPKWEPKE